MENSLYEIGLKENCVFCTIAVGLDPNTTLLYQDEELVAFKNITPAADHHYLIIPKEHIQDGKCLTEKHINLVEKLKNIGLQVLQQQGGDSNNLRLGFHWPPFYSVPHLHLHVISPAHQMSIVRRFKFKPGTRWFLTPSEVVEKLKHQISNL
ncbi:adenosine 5'-monophosphoramidase HINT3-like [Centruroides vittatus]|uniref:adenosine 5'-monophosphoramidase HINT3-like n=1 Tax=Centruroides vittatus TaxID=120091 RepID=UPI00350E8F2F